MSFRSLMVLFAASIALLANSSGNAQPTDSQARGTKLIVFVHGIHNSGGAKPADAWARTPGGPNWPSILAKDPVFSGVFKVYIHQYKTDRYNDNFDIGSLSLEMIQSIKFNNDISKFSDIYIIAHSMGGVISRQAMIDDSILRFKTKALFLFATPMNGSRLAAIARATGLGSIQTMQLGQSRDDPDAIFNRIKREWFQKEITIPSYCAYETEKTKVWWRFTDKIVPRDSVEPLCSHDVRPVRGSHTEIVQPIGEIGNGISFEAHNLLKEWFQSMLPEFKEAAAADEANSRIVIANCNGNFAYRGPYGRAHTEISRVLHARGIHNTRYSTPLSQVWIDNNSLAEIYKASEPTHVVIHFSCFENQGDNNARKRANRDASFFGFLRSFSNSKTRFVVYSRAFDRPGGCAYFNDAMKRVGLREAYAGRISLVGYGKDEIPGDGGQGDAQLLWALDASAEGRPNLPRECFAFRS